MKPLTDKRLEISIARMLRIGVLISATVVSAGGLLYLRNASKPRPDYSHFHAVQPSLRTIADILRSVSHIDPESVIQLGILILIATPIMRVALCVLGFSQQRDKLYIAVSTSVFIILIYSFFRGGR
jgi:uncharacterized membrane protein